ncbi:MAG: M48 family metalloprotease [Burkholderiales bacterium]|nr:M48 family metalloprotease [Burkholderiales bacterium]MCL4689143.1 M48 family metalloprotease [Burkholderiales bacterium]
MRVALAVLAIAISPSTYGVDVGRILDFGRKAAEIAPKLQEATREYTVEEEVALGDGLASGFLGAVRLHQDERLQRYVNRVGRWLAMQSERADLPWTFGVIDSETINAFAMPGGTVIVSHGLVKRLTSESELAGVLAHEIAHVVMKHQLSAIRSGAWGDVSASVGKELLASKVGRGGDFMDLRSKAMNAGVELVKDGVFLRPLDRSMEYDADRMGVVIATRGGYDPYGLVAVLTMLAQVKPDEAGASILFSTHPSPMERLAELERVVPEALEQYARQPQVEGRFRQAIGAK